MMELQEKMLRTSVGNGLGMGLCVFLSDKGAVCASRRTLPALAAQLAGVLRVGDIALESPTFKVQAQNSLFHSLRKGIE